MNLSGKKLQRLYASILSRKNSGIIAITALLLIILWLFFGSAFNYSENWQIATNMGTAVITVIMVWLVQQGQTSNRALQMKSHTEETAGKNT